MNSYLTEEGLISDRNETTCWILRDQAYFHQILEESGNLFFQLLLYEKKTFNSSVYYWYVSPINRTCRKYLRLMRDFYVEPTFVINALSVRLNKKNLQISTKYSKRSKIGSWQLNNASNNDFQMNRFYAFITINKYLSSTSQNDLYIFAKHH